MAAHEAPGPLTTKEILDFERQRVMGEKDSGKKMHVIEHIYIYTDRYKSEFICSIHEYRIICIYIYEHIL